jgi:hypothetical protein
MVPADEFGAPVIDVPGEAHADSDAKRTTTTKLFIRRLSRPYFGNLLGRFDSMRVVTRDDLHRLRISLV